MFWLGLITGPRQYFHRAVKAVQIAQGEKVWANAVSVGIKPDCAGVVIANQWNAGKKQQRNVRIEKRNNA
jgi:hypothetical protein